MGISNVNRVEVIDHTTDGEGRVFVKWEEALDVTLDLQDEGKTLKVFIRDKENDTEGDGLI